jgi:hypothetical protein
MRSLRTLHISPHPNVPDFNIPQIIQQNTGLRNLHIQVIYIIDTKVWNGYEVCLKHLYKLCIFLPPSQALEKSDLEKQMSGPLPNKVQNITLSGRGFTEIFHSLLRVSNITFKTSFIPYWFKVIEKKCYFVWKYISVGKSLWGQKTDSNNKSGTSPFRI